eukprot:1161871-Pelagomonas_calceolata.AAC.3
MSEGSASPSKASQNTQRKNFQKAPCCARAFRKLKQKSGICLCKNTQDALHPGCLGQQSHQKERNNRKETKRKEKAGGLTKPCSLPRYHMHVAVRPTQNRQATEWGLEQAKTRAWECLM